MLNKLFLFVLIFSILFLIKEAFSFYKAYKIGKQDITSYRLIGIGAAIAYIFTIIFTGF